MRSSNFQEQTQAKRRGLGFIPARFRGGRSPAPRDATPDPGGEAGVEEVEQDDQTEAGQGEGRRRTFAPPWRRRKNGPENSDQDTEPRPNPAGSAGFQDNEDRGEWDVHISYTFHVTVQIEYAF